MQLGLFNINLVLQSSICEPGILQSCPFYKDSEVQSSKLERRATNVPISYSARLKITKHQHSLSPYTSHQHARQALQSPVQGSLHPVQRALFPYSCSLASLAWPASQTSPAPMPYPASVRLATLATLSILPSSPLSSPSPPSPPSLDDTSAKYQASHASAVSPRALDLSP